MTPAAPDPAIVRALADLGTDGDELRLGGIPARDLAQRFGTPLYAFDAAVLRQRLALVRSALGPDCGVLYSLKANPSVAVAAVLQAAGAGVEVASGGELCVATAAGWPAAAVRFAGPGKSRDELAFALQQGIGVVHLESAAEAALLAELAGAAGVRPAVAVRVHLQKAPGARMRMAGASSRFGIDHDQLAALLPQLAREPRLRLCGLHCYGGTQNFEAAPLLDGIARLLALAADHERSAGVDLAEIDLGGGFGVPVYLGDGQFELEAFGRGLRPLLQQYARPGRRCCVELGRFLVAPAGIYLSRVLYTKVSGGRRQVVLDGGLHQCAAAAGVGTVLRRPPLLVRADAVRTTGGPEQSVGGPLCTPMDQFAEDFAGPELRAGDLVAVLNAGAYGLTYSPAAFLGHPTPAEVLVDQGRAEVARDRGRFADALAGQRWGPTSGRRSSAV